MVFGAKVFDFCRFFPNKFLTGEVVQTLVAPAAFGFTAIFPREKSVGKTFFAQLKETFAEIFVKPRAGQMWRGFRGFYLPLGVFKRIQTKIKHRSVFSADESSRDNSRTDF